MVVAIPIVKSDLVLAGWLVPKIHEAIGGVVSIRLGVAGTA